MLPRQILNNFQNTFLLRVYSVYSEEKEYFNIYRLNPEFVLQIKQ